jgi:hypothetical protein
MLLFWREAFFITEKTALKPSRKSNIATILHQALGVIVKRKNDKIVYINPTIEAPK